LTLLLDGDHDRCAPRWTLKPNSRVAGAIVIVVRSLHECQHACFNNHNCTGIDWNRTARRGRRCWLAGPWSGQLIDGTAMGVEHYDIIRPPQDCHGTSKPYITSPLPYYMQSSYVGRITRIARPFVRLHVCSVRVFHLKTNRNRRERFQRQN